MPSESEKMYAQQVVELLREKFLSAGVSERSPAYGGGFDLGRFVNLVNGMSAENQAKVMVMAEKLAGKVAE